MVDLRWDIKRIKNYQGLDMTQNDSMRFMLISYGSYYMNVVDHIMWIWQITLCMSILYMIDMVCGSWYSYGEWYSIECDVVLMYGFMDI